LLGGIGHNFSNYTGRIVGMARPKGLASTAWLMVALSTLGWSFVDWNHLRSLPHARVSFPVFVVIVVMIKTCAFICIWYYYQGRNWARVAVLLTSVWTLYNLRLLGHGNLVHRFVIASEGLLGLFFLYWLNTPEIRRFFAGGKSESIQSAPMP
jgi:hypothetical protein